MHDCLELELPWDVTAPRLARHTLAQWGATAETDVVVSELVTNGLEHGEPPMTLVALRTADVVHIEVSDARHDLGRSSPESAGLRLVEAFSTAWGVQYHPNDGKVVWAEFPL